MKLELIDELLAALDRWPRRHISFFAGAKPAAKTFGELAADVRNLAQRLQAAGVTAGMRAGILAPNSYSWVVLDLALQQLRMVSVAFPDQLPYPVRELPGRYRLDLLFIAGERYGEELLSTPSAVPIEEILGSGPALTRAGRALAAPAGDRASEPSVPTAATAPTAPTAGRAAGDAGGEVISITFSSGSSGKLKTLRVTGSGTKQTIVTFCSLFEFLPDDLFLIFLPLSSYQQRIMVYGCILFGTELGVIDALQLFKAFLLWRPTLLLAPPILFENVHLDFVRGLRRLAPHRRLAFRLLNALQAALPLPALRARLARIAYAKLHALFGGRIRILWTGMAPIRTPTLRFFSRAGLELYEAYGLNECGPIASNSAAAHRLGSVGRPIVPGSIVLAPDGEILVKNPLPIANGYEDCEPGDAERVFRADGLIGTGDLGYFDAAGFLYLTGRKQETIVTREGQKISPELLEKKVNEHPAVLQSVVFGNHLPALAAVVVVETLDEATRQAIEAHVAGINEAEAACFAIQQVHLTTAKFSADNGQLTRNLKLDRRAIFAAHRTALDRRSA
jgi:long-chain acyl-CoA synthetase